jgi:hypothetical protein
MDTQATIEELLETVFSILSILRLHNEDQRDKRNIFSSERILHKDYDRKGSVGKKFGLSLKGLDTKTNWLVVNRQS